MSENETKVCLTIAGLDPSGGAGLIADVKAFSAFGCFATAAVTSVTYQNTQGVFGAAHQTPQSVEAQIEPILADFEVAAVKTGMLPTKPIIAKIADIIAENNLKNIVVDPVVRSTSGFDLIDDAALSVLIERLFPLASVVTPNIPETERICKFTIKTETDIRKAAKIMQSMGATNVLIKGGHVEKLERTVEKKATDYLFLGDELEKFEGEFINATSTHGTGCTLAAALAANLALGKILAEAVKIGKDFVTEGIRKAPKIGKGYSPIGIDIWKGEQ